MLLVNFLKATHLGWVRLPLIVVALASIAYSRCGRTMAQYGGINAASDKSAQDHVPCGAARSRTSVTWGVWWLASAPEKHGEMGGHFPAVRHEHSLGLIGWSCSPLRLRRRREVENVAWLGSPENHFPVICKKESRFTDSGRQIVYL